MIDQLARWIAEARCTVVFTGAGISTESGIPDFRSPGGVWATSQPVYYDDFVTSESSRLEYWRQKSEAFTEFADATPNIGHQVLADWEARGQLHGLITQNIDGLHQDAGSKKVLEIHGTARSVACLDCAWRDDTGPWNEKFNAEGVPPTCPDCGGHVKHATVSFGQSLDADVLSQSFAWIHECDLFLALGSSLVVQPAANMPVVAKQQGAQLVIITRDNTPLDRDADLVINGSLGETLVAVDSAVKELRDD
ncbi:MAG: NAD-dependent deacylase [Planctomycetaceae bacterium]